MSFLRHGLISPSSLANLAAEMGHDLHQLAQLSGSRRMHLTHILIWSMIISYYSVYLLYSFKTSPNLFCILPVETAGNVVLCSIKVSRHLKIQGLKQPDAHPGVVSLTCSKANADHKHSRVLNYAKIKPLLQIYFIDDGLWIPLRLLATEYLLGTSRSECFENCTSRAHLEDLTNLCWSAPFRCWAQHGTIWHSSLGETICYHLLSVASRFCNDNIWHHGALCLWKPISSAAQGTRLNDLEAGKKHQQAGSEDIALNFMKQVLKCILIWLYTIIMIIIYNIYIY